MEGAVEEIESLSRSQTRVHLLKKLHHHRQLEKDTLKDSVDVSRTTFQRNLNTLKEDGWIENSNRKYRITCAGDWVAEKFFELVDTIEATHRLSPFLDELPLEEIDLELHSLADAEVTVTKPHNSYAVVNKHIEALQSITTFRGLLAAVGRDALEIRWQ